MTKTTTVGRIWDLINNFGLLDGNPPSQGQFENLEDQILRVAQAVDAGMLSIAHALARESSSVETLGHNAIPFPGDGRLGDAEFLWAEWLGGDLAVTHRNGRGWNDTQHWSKETVYRRIRLGDMHMEMYVLAAS
jgi:hypothetical protein